MRLHTRSTHLKSCLTDVHLLVRQAMVAVAGQGGCGCVQGELLRLMPAAVLVVQHPAPAASAAAHALFCALLGALPEGDRGLWAAAYVQRALPAFPAAVPLPQLTTAVDTLAKLLPIGSLVPVRPAANLWMPVPAAMLHCTAVE